MKTRPKMEPTVVREGGCSLIMITLIILLSFSAFAQPLGIETAMLDIPDGYTLEKQDTVKAILIISSDEWTDQDDFFGFPELMCGYVVNSRYKPSGFFRWFLKNNRRKYLDHNKIELKNVIIWSSNVNVIHVKN